MPRRLAQCRSDPEGGGAGPRFARADNPPCATGVLLRRAKPNASAASKVHVTHRSRALWPPPAPADLLLLLASRIGSGCPTMRLRPAPSSQRSVNGGSALPLRRRPASDREFCRARSSRALIERNGGAGLRAGVVRHRRSESRSPRFRTAHVRLRLRTTRFVIRSLSVAATVDAHPSPGGTLTRRRPIPFHTSASLRGVGDGC